VGGTQRIARLAAPCTRCYPPNLLCKTSLGLLCKTSLPTCSPLSNLACIRRGPDELVQKGVLQDKPSFPCLKLSQPYVPLFPM